ncbi:hypothetical protein ACLB1G_00990 [Oxalobacteraceae bacterium A2-2]
MTAAKIFLAGCASTAIAMTAMLALTGASGSSKARFDEITVGRINIEEPDGTKRIIISNRAQFPGAFDKGQEIARPDRRSFAGMLFVNDEGTENGGLIQKGSIVDGKVSAGLSLTFDRFRQDQALQLLHEDSDARSATSVVINDVPNPELSPIGSMEKYRAAAKVLPAEQRQAYWSKLGDEGRLSQPRVFLGTSRDKASALMLHDAKGRPRMMLMVTAAGQPTIQMLDEQGAVVKTVSP